MFVKLSIIVPVYNAEKYIKKCLDSILSSSLENIELIVIDDGSEDNSFSVCQSYAQKDSRVFAMKKRNEGRSKTRNLGLEYARGEYVTFADCDDWVNTDVYKMAYENAKQYDADIVVYNAVRKYGDISKPYTNIVQEKVWNGHSDISRFVMGTPKEKDDSQNGIHSICPIWNKLYKKNFLDSNEILFLDYHIEDVLFNIYAFAYAKKITFLPIEGYCWRIREGSASNREIRYRKGFEMELWGIAMYLLECTSKYAYREDALCYRVISDVIWQCLECNILNKENNGSFIRRYFCFKEMMGKPIYKDAMEWRFSNPCSRKDVLMGKLKGMKHLPVFFITATFLRNWKCFRMKWSKNK